MEHRSFRRVNVNAGITLKAGGRIFSGMLENISMGGLFAGSVNPEAASAGDIFEISVPLPAGSGNDRIVVTGMAIRVNESGIAFRFIDTGPETLRALFSFIYHSDL